MSRILSAAEQAIFNQHSSQAPLTEDEIFNQFREDQANRGTIEKGIDFIGEVAGSAADWVTGANTEAEIPKLSDIGVNKLATSATGKAKIMGVLASSSDDNRIQKIFQETIPDAQFQQDQFGNLVVIAPTSRNDKSQPLTWQRFYPNPQGADLATAYNVSSVAGLAAPVNAFVGGTGITAAALTGGVESGILEAFSSYLARDEYQVMEVPKGMGGGVLAKPFGDLVGAAYNKIKNIVTKARVGDMPTGEAEQAISDALTEEGLNPSDVLDTVYREMNADINAGANPADAARYRTAQNLPTPVQMTRGDVGNDKSRQLFEDSVQSGTYGNAAREDMQTLRLGQSNDIQQNLGQIQQQMAGPNGQVIDKRAGGALAQTELVAAKDAQGAAKDLAYDSARASEAFLDPANGSQIAGTILQNVRTNFSPINAPQAFKIFNDEMLPLLESGQSLRSIFETRQILTQHAKQAGPEGAAAAAMNRQLDQQLIDQSNDLLLYGDSDAVGNWLDAISQHKDFMKKWETGGILKDLTSEGIRDGEKVLNKDSDDVANFIFGLSLNPNKTNMGRNLMTLKKELAPETWNSLRQEFFIKLSEKMLKTNGELSGQTFATAWKTIKTNKTVVNTLFTQAERANIDALASTAMRISSSAKNYSNSANSMLGALRKFMDILGPLPITKGLARLPVVSQGMGSVATAQMAVNPVVKSPSLMKRLLTTTSAVTAGAETVEGAANALLGNTSSATSFGENK